MFICSGIIFQFTCVTRDNSEQRNWCSVCRSMRCLSKCGPRNPRSPQGLITVTRRLFVPSYCKVKRKLFYRIILIRFKIPFSMNKDIKQCLWNRCAVRSLQINKYINTLRTCDADLRFYITTVQDG